MTHCQPQAATVERLVGRGGEHGDGTLGEIGRKPFHTTEFLLQLGRRS